ncbi:unnamed protein product [Protopolystoma xenopodis]|uniref:Uncharacterized protein n=1 Tax=Protopolystoma xenopodis TaxID=117903 RepID=A0A448WN32_9PLAT|nr:unnamed protein product [Protopolystoma xenopodis]
MRTSDGRLQDGKMTVRRGVSRANSGPARLGRRPAHSADEASLRDNHEVFWSDFKLQSLNTAGTVLSKGRKYQNNSDKNSRKQVSYPLDVA